MPLATFSDIARQVQPLAEQAYLHVMGEPLLHPAFADILACAGEIGLPINVTTNGTCFDTQAAEALLLPAVRQVNISLHSLEERPDRQTAEHDLAQVCSFIERAFIHRPDLYINVRLWNIGTQGGGAARSALPGDNDWIRATLEKNFGVALPIEPQKVGRKSRRLLNRLYLHTDSRFSWPGETGSDIKTKGWCPALSDQVGILVDGTVVPCCLDAEGRMALGNCLEMPLAGILSSERASVMREGFARGMLVEEMCRGCLFCRRFKTRTR